MKLKGIKKFFGVLIMLASSIHGPLVSAASFGSAFTNGSTNLGIGAGSGCAFFDN